MELVSTGKSPTYLRFKWLSYFLVVILLSVRCTSEGDTFISNSSSSNDSGILSTDSLLSILDTKEEHHKIPVLHDLVISVWLNYPDQAMKYGMDALSLSKKFSDSTNISKSLRLIAGVYYYKGDYDQSLNYNTKALDIAISLEDSTLINNGYNNIGLLYYNLGSHQIALEYLLRSVDIKQKTGETYGLSSSLNNIGLIFDRVESYDQARKYFQEAYNTALITKDKSEMYALNNIAITYLKEGSLDLAMQYFRNGLNLSQQYDNINWGSVSLRGIGEIFILKNQLDSAKTYCLQSLDASVSIEDKKGISEAYNVLAKYAKANQNHALAIDYLNESNELAKQLKLRDQLLDNLKLYISIYEDLGELSLVKSYQTQYQTLRDSLFKDVVRRNLSLVPIKLKEEADRLRLADQQREIQSRKTRNNIFLIILILIMPLLIALIIIDRKLRKANRKITKQSNEYRDSYETVKLLSEIGAEIISSLSIDTISERVYRNVNKLMPAEGFDLGIINKETKQIDFPRSIENDKVIDPHSYDIDADSDRLNVISYYTKEVVFTNNLYKDFPDYPQPKIGLQPDSAICIPISHKNEVSAILMVYSFKKNAYNNFHLSLLRNLSNYISIAIENAQTFQKLGKSYKQLKELDEFKESMTAMIVHDFKNSLNTVINFSEGKPNEHRMRGIRQAGQFMLNMVMNILDVQKFEETNPKLSLANYPISRLVRQATDQLTYMMEQKSIKLEIIQDRAFEVRLDHDLIVRVIVNILSNAIKYSRQNGVIAIAISSEGDHVQVSIQDQGLGIPEDQLETVFDKYAQVVARKEGVARSTGLGLTFCKMVIEAHGGTIWVESIENIGSTFYFTVPLVEGLEGQPVESIHWQNDKTILLNENEKKSIHSHLADLSQWEVYDYSDVIEILNQIKTESENVSEWKDQMMKALHNGNEELFKSLINQ